MCGNKKNSWYRCTLLYKRNPFALKERNNRLNDMKLFSSKNMAESSFIQFSQHTWRSSFAQIKWHPIFVDCFYLGFYSIWFHSGSHHWSSKEFSAFHRNLIKFFFASTKYLHITNWCRDGMFISFFIRFDPIRMKGCTMSTFNKIIYLSIMAFLITKCLLYSLQLFLFDRDS